MSILAATQTKKIQIVLQTQEENDHNWKKANFLNSKKFANEFCWSYNWGKFRQICKVKKFARNLVKEKSGLIAAGFYLQTISWFNLKKGSSCAGKGNFSRAGDCFYGAHVRPCRTGPWCSSQIKKWHNLDLFTFADQLSSSPASSWSQPPSPSWRTSP